MSIPTATMKDRTDLDLGRQLQTCLTTPSMRPGAGPLYHEARERFGGLVQLPGGAWLTLSHAATQAVMLDECVSRMESARGELGEPDGTDGEFNLALDAMRVMLMNQDNPGHLRMRRILRHAFYPAAVEAWRETIEGLCTTMLEKVAGRDEYDFLSEVAYPLPEGVMCALLRVPAEDHASWAAWTRDNVRLNRVAAAEEDLLARARQSAANFYRYAKQLIADRRVDLGDDLVSVMIRAEEDGQKLSEQELIGTVIQLIQAAHDTTANLIGNAVVILLRDRKLQDRLRAQPGDVERFITEVLRMDGPVHFALPRTTIEDISHEDKRIPAGSQVIAGFAAANRDPAVFADPDMFDIDRRTNQRHLAFGTGMHNCIGRPFALLESVSMLQAVVSRFPAMELAEEPVRSDEYLNVWKSVKVRRSA